MAKNAQDKIQWFDPHSGKGGAAIPLPQAAKALAMKMTGTKSTASAAVAKVQKAMGKQFKVEFKFDVDYGGEEITTSKTEGMLTLQVGEFGKGGPVHLWRMLRGRKLPNGRK